MHDIDRSAGPAASGGRASPQSQRSRETAELFGRLTSASGADRTSILQQVVLLNTGVARSLAQRYRHRGIDLEDLEQTAYVSLIMATRSFDPKRGHDFLSFAVPTILGGLRQHFRDHGWTIQVPRRVQEVQVLIQRAGLAEADEPRYAAHTVARLARQLELSHREVEAALRARGCFRPASLDDARERARAETFHAGRLSRVDERERVELRTMLAPLIDHLSPREQRLLRLRFADDRTQQSIAEELGLTQAQISRLLTQVIAQLRRELEQTEASPQPVSRPVSRPAALSSAMSGGSRRSSEEATDRRLSGHPR